MNSRRRTLLILLPLLVGLLFLGQIGPVEVTIWFVLVGLWLYAFFGWARRAPAVPRLGQGVGTSR